MGKNVYLVQAHRLNEETTRNSKSARKSIRIFIFYLALEFALCFLLMMNFMRRERCIVKALPISQSLNFFSAVAFTVIDCVLLCVFIQSLPKKFGSIFWSHIKV